MTTGLKRLCEAAEAVEYSYQENLRPAEAEAVVRAVLMALREPSKDMAKAGWTTFDYPPSPSPQEVWRAMIDHILAEPAKA